MYETVRAAVALHELRAGGAGGQAEGWQAEQEAQAVPDRGLVRSVAHGGPMIAMPPRGFDGGGDPAVGEG